MERDGVSNNYSIRSALNHQIKKTFNETKHHYRKLDQRAKGGDDNWSVIPTANNDNITLGNWTHPHH